MRHAEEILLPPGTATLPSLKPTWRVRRGRSHRGRLEHRVEEREHVSTLNFLDEIGTHAIGQQRTTSTGKSLTSTLR